MVFVEMADEVNLSHSDAPLKKVGIVYERELDVGGVETHLLALFRHCRDRYFFEVFSPVSDRFYEKAHSYNVRFHPVDRFSPLDFRIIPFLTRNFIKEKLDLIHIHSPVAAVPGRVAAKLCKLPVIVTFHLTAPYYYGNRKTSRASFGRFLYINLDRLLNYFLTDRLIFVSQRSFDEATGSRLALTKKSVVIGNGIDLEGSQKPSHVEKSIQDLRSSFGVSKDEIIMTFSGRLDEQKGIDVLIKALTYLDPAYRDILKVWLVGSGHLEADLKAMTQTSGLQSMIMFRGYQERVIDFLLASDVFVLPSYYETMPFSLLEAMAVGLPCIVTDVGDNALTVENDVQGLVIPPNDPNALVSAIHRMIRDANFRQKCGERAREKVKKFDQKLNIRQVETIYDRLL